MGLNLLGTHAEKLLGHARFMALNFRPEEAKYLEELCPDTFCRAVGLTSERQALHKLVELFDALSLEYNSTLAEDKELLDGGISFLDGARFQGLVIRYGEKMILRGFRNIVGMIDPLFDLSPAEFEKAVADKWARETSTIHRYVSENLTAMVTKKQKTTSDSQSSAKETDDTTSTTGTLGQKCLFFSICALLGVWYFYRS